MSVADTKQSRLAINGGEPIRSTRLPYGHQSLTEDDVQAVIEVLRSDWITTGPKVDEFEDAFAEAVGAAYAVSFSSGTAALHGAVFAAGIEAGDEVITTPLTFCATANCVLYQGATPVFADVTRDTLTIDPEQVERRITARTKALLPVDFAGHPADLDVLLSIAERHGLTVIEDASHALGARYRARPIGSISHLTTFSFHPVKHLTTGEGGMATTTDAEHARRLRTFRNHGINSDARDRQMRDEWYYEMTALGYNYRLSDIGCALGLSQIPRLASNLARRRQIASLYGEALAGVPGIQLPLVRPDVEPAWHLYQVRLNGPGHDRDGVFRALRAEGLGVNVHYIPVHCHPYYEGRFGRRVGHYPIAEKASSELISLPMFHGMSDKDVNDVVAAVRKVVGCFAS